MKSAVLRIGAILALCALVTQGKSVSNTKTLKDGTVVTTVTEHKTVGSGKATPAAATVTTHTTVITQVIEGGIKITTADGWKQCLKKFKGAKSKQCVQHYKQQYALKMNKKKKAGKVVRRRQVKRLRTKCLNRIRRGCYRLRGRKRQICLRSYNQLYGLYNRRRRRRRRWRCRRYKGSRRILCLRHHRRKIFITKRRLRLQAKRRSRQWSRCNGRRGRRRSRCFRRYRRINRRYYLTRRRLLLLQSYRL